MLMEICLYRFDRCLKRKQRGETSIFKITIYKRHSSRLSTLVLLITNSTLCGRTQIQTKWKHTIWIFSIWNCAFLIRLWRILMGLSLWICSTRYLDWDFNENWDRNYLINEVSGVVFFYKASKKALEIIAWLLSIKIENISPLNFV